MSRILAIDTTSDFASIALVEDGRVVEECALQSSDGFAHVLFGSVAQLLARHALDPRSIDVYASASGPGSFTGVRVGLTAAKGLAEAAGRKAIGISNLQAIASFGSAPLRAVVMDARRGEIFGAVYDASLRLVCGEVVMKFEDWLKSIPENVEFIAAVDNASFPGPMTRAPRFLAGAIGKIAASQIDRASDPAAVEANYVRRSDAELHWKG